MAGASDAGATRGAAPGDTLVVYKSPTCGCCEKWVEHMRTNGFHVVVHDTADVSPVKARAGVTAPLASCHTAFVAGYAVEGHVPAEDVRRLLRERPPVTGLAAPGMPNGSLGMEGRGRDSYDVVAFTRDAGAAVFASHR